MKKSPHDIRGAFMTRSAADLPALATRSDDQQRARLAELRERKDLKRTSAVDGVDIEARTVELAFSSEIEYRRWFGVEILSHAPGAMRMGRLQDGAAVLWNHNWNDQRGVVESARIDGDKRGRASVRMSRSAAGETLLNDVADKITRHVSVGYRVHDARLVEVRDDDVEVWLVTDWEPYEISFVTVPADTSVGVGRSLEIPQEENNPTPAETANVRKAETTPVQPKGTPPEMKIVTKRDAQGNLVRAEVDEHGNITKVLETIEEAGEGARSHEQRGERAAQARAASILAMGEQFARAVPNAPELARAAIANGQSAEEFQRSVMAAFSERTSRPLSEQSEGSAIGMTDRDVRNFSFLRAVRALAPNATRADREAAAFEFECSRAAQEQYGKEAQGILIPSDVLARAFNAGGAANTPAGAQSGNLLVQNSVLTGSWIDMLRNRTTIMRLGTTMGGLVGTVDIPKQSGGATGYWVGEGEDAQEGTPTLGQISFAAKTVAAYTDITRRLMKQSSPDAEGIVRRDLNAALAQAIDLAGYYGSGTDKQPRGIKNYSGINAVDFAVQGAPTFAELVKMETEVAADNADIGQMGYVGHSRFRGHAKTTAKMGAGTEATIWEPGGTVNGYRAEITNQVSADDVFFGNFADLIIAMWGGLDLTVDASSLSKSGGLRLVVFQDVDMNLRRVESVCWGSHLVS